jgi:hypothetical protein
MSLTAAILAQLIDWRPTLPMKKRPTLLTPCRAQI